MRIKTVGEANPKAQLSSDMLQFGPGGASALDTWLKRVGSGQLELRYDLLPTADQSGYIGSATKRFAKIYAVEIAVSNMLFNFHLIPDVDNTYDLGSSLKRWRDLYLAGAIKALAGGVAVNLLPDQNATRDLGSGALKWSNLYLSGVCDVGGWLNVAGFTVITNARVLQNVTADVAIITSGRFGMARLPLGTAGYVLEAQGTLDPMYVNPNGRYQPASHTHYHSALLGVGPNDHHAQIHNHAGDALSPDSIAVNTLSVAVSVNCQNWLKSADYIFGNDLRMTEAEKLGFPKGLAFLNDKGKVLMVLDEKGNLSIAGKIKQLKTKKAKRGVAA